MTAPLQFNSIQFIQFHQIHYKSKRPNGYRISHSKLYQTLMHKDSIRKITIIIQAGSKMPLIYGYSIDWFNWHDWSIHFHNCIGYRPHHKNIHIILYCTLYMIKEQNIASYGDNSRLLRSVHPVLKYCGSRLHFIAAQVQPLHILDSCSISVFVTVFSLL